MKSYKSEYKGTEMDASWGKANTAVQGVKVNREELPKDAEGKVEITLPETYTKEETNVLLGAEAQAREEADAALAEQINLKQSKTDNSLTTSSKQVVGAINENKQRIDNLFAIGRYLAIWNAKTGLPTSNPSGTPYPYKAGDWFLVGIIADEGGTNYMPNGTEYTGEASTTPYVDEVPLKVGDRFFFDGTTWKPLVATYPEDNNVKYDAQTLTDAQKQQARANIGAQEELFERGTGENSVVQKGGNNQAVGANSTAVGSGTKAQDDSSHSEGYHTIANGHSSHTEGWGTKANGYSSHAEGIGTNAEGNYSHAEGYYTKAEGYKSHAEGHYTETRNEAEHAEGIFNKSNTGTRHSVGIGNINNKKNAFEIMRNGDVYVVGLGGYDGTNAGETGVQTLQQILELNRTISIPNQLPYEDRVKLYNSLKKAIDNGIAIQLTIETSTNTFWNINLCTINQAGNISIRLDRVDATNNVLIHREYAIRAADYNISFSEIKYNLTRVTN